VAAAENEPVSESRGALRCNRIRVMSLKHHGGRCNPDCSVRWHHREMVDTLSTPELLDAWRDTVRAADLTERLAAAATVAVRESDLQSEASAEIVDLAEKAAEAATRAAERARTTAVEAAAVAERMLDRDVPDKRATAPSPQRLETQAAAVLADRDRPKPGTESGL
jgi:hypothetical protein